MPLLGELYLLKVSPWSRKIRDVLRHTGATVAIREYHPIITGFILKLRGRIGIGGGESKVTAPIYFPRDSAAAIMDGYVIANILDDARLPTASTLFPSEHSQLIEQLVGAAEVCANYWRGYIFDELMKHPQLAAGRLIPPMLRWLYMPLQNCIIRTLMGHLANKYMPETLEARKTGAIENALDTINNALEANGSGEFLVGNTTTYADIAVAYSLPFVYSTSSVWKVVGNHPIGDQYAALKNWGTQYWAKYDARKSANISASKSK